MKITKEGGARSPGSVGAMEILPRLEGTLLLLLLLASSVKDFLYRGSKIVFV
jgi:hypothetical protein